MPTPSKKRERSASESSDSEPSKKVRNSCEISATLDSSMGIFLAKLRISIEQNHIMMLEAYLSMLENGLAPLVRGEPYAIITGGRTRPSTPRLQIWTIPQSLSSAESSEYGPAEVC